MQKPLLAVLMSSAFLTFNAQAADLIQVYKQALANDATYASARAALAAGQERTTQGRAGLLPTVSATGSVTAPGSSAATSTCRSWSSRSVPALRSLRPSRNSSRCCANRC